MTDALDTLLIEARGCEICAVHLPLGCRPVVKARATARLLIIGQAPGTRVHASGIPWDDPTNLSEVLLHIGTRQAHVRIVSVTWQPERASRDGDKLFSGYTIISETNVGDA